MCVFVVWWVTCVYVVWSLFVCVCRLVVIRVCVLWSCVCGWLGVLVCVCSLDPVCVVWSLC